MKRKILLGTLSIIVVGIAVFVLLLVQSVRTASARSMNKHTMSALGLALMKYADAHGGVSPESLDDLATAGFYDPVLLEHVKRTETQYGVVGEIQFLEPGNPNYDELPGDTPVVRC